MRIILCQLLIPLLLFAGRQHVCAQTYTFSTLAGHSGAGSADGAGAAARFNGPYGVAVDGFDNVYVAVSGSDTIRKITPAGIVTTLAGLVGNTGNSDGEGRVARFHTPEATAADSAGNLCIGDSGNSIIRKGAIAISSSLELRITRAAGQVTLAWPASATGVALEDSRDLGAANGWSPVAAGPVPVNGTNYVTNAITAGKAFYRLSGP